MATFTVPTYDVTFSPETGREKRHSLMRFYTFKSAYTVLITSGVATPSPGRTVVPTSEITGADAGSGEHGRAVFIGGNTYTVTAGEGTILTTAGYTVT